jgi:hypothetical protein
LVFGRKATLPAFDGLANLRRNRIDPINRVSAFDAVSEQAGLASQRPELVWRARPDLHFSSRMRPRKASIAARASFLNTCDALCFATSQLRLNAGMSWTAYFGFQPY